jgi:hypothetical protein
MSVSEAVRQLGLRDSIGRQVLRESGAITVVAGQEGVWGRDLFKAEDFISAVPDPQDEELIPSIEDLDRDFRALKRQRR